MKRRKPNVMFWFSHPGGRLRFDDGRTARVGETHVVRGPLRMCYNGLHASRRLLDADSYFPYPPRRSRLWVVRLSGDVTHGRDKSCASRRTYLASMSAEETEIFLRRAKCAIALECVKYARKYFDRNQYRTVVKWLRDGKRGVFPPGREVYRILYALVIKYPYTCVLGILYTAVSKGGTLCAVATQYYDWKILRRGAFNFSSPKSRAFVRRIDDLIIPLLPAGMRNQLFTKG